MTQWIRLLLTASQLVCILCETTDGTIEGRPSLLQETPDDKKAILKSQKIVPHVLAMNPKHVLFGDYNGKEISFGNTFTADEIMEKPNYLDWPTNGTKALYCLFAIGIDVPNKKKPKLRDFRHWMVGNIPGTDIERGETFLPYVGAGNFLDQGLHRIVFVVYQQPGKRKIHFYERILRKKRPIYVQRGNTSTKRTAEKYSFREPVAANFLTVQTDMPQVTTDYYEFTSENIPPDWQGISLVPEMFGLTIDLPQTSEEKEKAREAKRLEAEKNARIKAKALAKKKKKEDDLKNRRFKVNRFGKIYYKRIPKPNKYTKKREEEEAEEREEDQEIENVAMEEDGGSEEEKFEAAQKEKSNKKKKAKEAKKDKAKETNIEKDTKKDKEEDKGKSNKKSKGKGNEKEKGKDNEEDKESEKEKSKGKK